MHRLILLFILVLAATGCNKEAPVEPEPEDDATGVAYAFRNSVAWEAKVKISETDSVAGLLSMSVYRESSPGRNRASLRLRSFAPNFERQPLLSGSPATILDDMAYYSVFDVDVLFDIYELDSTAADNYIEIIRYDPERLEIEGVFNVTLRLAYEESIPLVRPEILKFTQGTFVTSVEPGWFD